MTVTCLFSLVLVINGEKATLETPTFAQKRRRTLDMLIRSLYQDLMPDLHKVPGFPFSCGGSGRHSSNHGPWGELGSHGTCCLDCLEVTWRVIERLCENNVVLSKPVKVGLEMGTV